MKRKKKTTFSLDDVNILVIGDHVWGRGATLEEALKGASKPRKYIAYIAHKSVYLDEMGDFCYPAGVPVEKPREIFRHGLPKQEAHVAKPST